MIELGIILLIFVLSYVIILKDFRFSLYILLVLSALLHKELFSFYRWDLMPVRAFMLAVFCAGITKWYFWLMQGRDQRKLKDLFSNPFLILMSLLWFFRGLSILFTKNVQASLLLFGFFTTVLFLMFFIYHAFKKDRKGVLKYVDFYILILFVLSLFGYFQYLLYSKTGVIIGALWNIPGNIPRVGATFWDVNHYGSLIAGILPVLGVLALGKIPIKKRIYYAIAFVSLLITLVLTNSRTSWMIAFFSFLFFITLILVRKYGAKGILYMAAVFLFLLAPVLREYSDKSSPFRARIKQFFHYRIDSFDSHLMLLTGAYQIFEKYPLLGGGYGGFFEHFSKTGIAPIYFGRDPAALNTRVPAHTIWGELIAETGIIGLSIFLLLILFIVGTLYFSFMKLNEWRDYVVPAAMLSVILGWLIAGVFYSYNTEFFWIIFCLYFCYGVSILGEKYQLKNILSRVFRSRTFYRATLVVVGAVVIFVGLGRNHLVPWDEAIYAKVAKNMVVKNEYLTQYWWSNRVWYEKPPLYMWIVSLIMRVIGVNSLSVRLPSAIFGLLTVFLVYQFGKKLFNKTVGYIAGLVLLTTIHFVYYSRTSMLDITATYFITLSVYLYYCAKQEENRAKLYWILSGLSLGLGVMTKGVVGLIPIGIISLYEIYLFVVHKQKVTKKLLRYYLSFLGSSIAIALPWHLYMYHKFGSSFLNNYIGYHVIQRVVSDIENKGKPFYWYFVVLKVSMRLWFLAFLGAIPYSIYWTYKKNKQHALLIIWSVFIMAFFSISRSKLVWYIIPIYPVVAILVGIFIERVLNFVMRKYKPLDNITFKLLFLYFFTVFMLMYFFYNRHLVYTSDLTGSQAKLLMFKDEKFGVDQKLYVDRIELPLVLFYTDGPFSIIDFNPFAGRYPVVPYDEQLVILGKRGRFSENYPVIKKTPDIAAEDGDWILWSYESDYELDQERLEFLENEINKGMERPQTYAEIQSINKLQQKKRDLEKEIDRKLSLISP
ncbi:glycosyltransferase family 39 protein [Patescibacteria group bacterium]|nr:glycosyltransferase family 39 protein [Patescibacteria group bacterium]